MEESNVQNPKAPTASSTFIWVYSFTLALFDHLSYLYYGVISRLLALIGLEKRRHISIHTSSKSPDNAILVTGSSSGIGRFLAFDWFNKGYIIFATVRKTADGQYLEDIANNISRESGRLTGRLIPIVIDLADPFSLNTGLQKIQEHINRSGLKLVAVINNAAEFTLSVTESMNNDDIERMIQTNLLSPLYLTKRLFPLLKEAKGRIVNIGSPNSWVPSPGFSMYSTTKAALRAWSLALNIEAHLWDISVSLIEPGVIRTNALFKVMQALNSLANETTLDGKVRQRYMPLIKYYEMTITKTSDFSIHPVHVGRAVSHAFLASYPKRIYYVGWDARIMAAASWLLGDENVCRIIETMATT